MRNSTGFLLVLALASFPGAAVAGGKYNIDPSHSNLQFAVKHMVISDVKGTFQDFSGTVVYDEEEIGNSSVRITIKTESLNTGNDDRDNHLRSPDFFDAGQYPEITFQSKAIRKSGSGFVAAGTLTMHGVTKEIELPFEILGKVTDPWGNTYQLRVWSDSIAIVSVGPDGMRGTEDDFQVTTPRERRRRR